MALFGSNEHTKNEFNQQLEMQIDQTSRRTAYLEKDSTKIDEAIKIRDTQLTSELHEMLSESELLREEVTKIRISMNQLIKKAQKLILDLQQMAKKEDKERVETLADEWQPESYITKRGFLKLTKDELIKSLKKSEIRNALLKK